MIHHNTAQLLEQLRALDVRLRVEDGRLRINAPKGSLTPALEAALVDQRQELLQALTARDAATRRPALTPVARDGTPLRLSFLQERLWVLEQLQPGHTAYNLAVCSSVLEGIDIALLQAAIRRTVARHEILRSRFVLTDGVPSVRVASAEETSIVVRDLRGLADHARREALASAAPDATHEPFDLAGEAPVRFTVLQVGDTSAALLFATHHIAMDSWSLGVLGTEVTRQYAALAEGAASGPMPEVQYVDFAHWQRELMSGPAADQRLRYWTDRLAGLPEMSAFPTDRVRPADIMGSGGAHDFTWSRELYANVRALARDTDSTVYMVLLAAMAVLLARNSGQTDVALGSPIGTRDLSQLEDMLGPILTPLVLRFDLADDPSFATVVRRARDAILDGHQHQDVPFETLVQALNPERSLGHSPLFQVAVVLHNAPNASASQIHGGGAIYDLTVFAVERDGAMTGSIEYRADLYDAETIERIDAQLQALLSAVVVNSALRVSSIPLISREDAAELVGRFNPAPADLDVSSVVAQFARTATTFPTAIAVQSAGATLTYAELDQRSAAVAHALRGAGAGTGSLVALATERDAGLMVGLLGILRSGAAYLPIDLSYPAERISFMIRDSGAQYLVTTKTVSREFKEAELPSSVLTIDHITAVNGVHPSDLQDLTTPDAAAYLIYTSGSTGLPKGVKVSHGALSNFLGAMRREPGITATDAVLSVTSLAFDISILELLLPLVTGARTIIVGKDVQSDGSALAALMRTAAPTIVQSTPSGWRLLMQAGWLGAPGVTAIVGGETMPRDLAEWLESRVDRVYNAYGPTETTVWSTLAQLAPGDPITVGRPIANTRVYVLDAAQQVLPIGVPGEVFIGGAGVADGYHARPELTAERFLQDPFHSGGRMYRTGDFGRWRSDGRLEHLGRMDGQVKLRGFRIETGEIEAALLTQPAVSAAVVGIRNGAENDPRLVAWVRLRDDADCTVSELRRHLRRSLPEFMVPSMLLLVDAIPLTPNGKIDRAALPDPFGNAMGTTREFVEPTTPAERMIAEIWRGLLGVERVGATDRFFDLGGHSLLAMQAAAEISARASVRVEPRLLFFRTLSDLAAICVADRSAPARALHT